MGIRIDNKKNRVYINGKEYVLITEHDDDELGHILECCTVNYSDYAKFFLRENNGQYETITDEEVFKKIVEKYTEPYTGIIED